MYPGLVNTESKRRLEPLDDRRLKQQGSDAQFTPTLAHHERARHSHLPPDVSLWGIDEADESAEYEPIIDERNYWEQDINAKDVFKYLRNRLLATKPASQSSKPIETTRAQRSDSDSLRRAALIRRHHPLTSRRSDTTVLASPSVALRASRGRTSIVLPAPVLGRRQSGREESVASCASQSTKRSRTARSDSSKNYWDIGSGSLGSGGWNVDWGQA